MSGKVLDVEVESEQRFGGDEGYLVLRRLVVRNRRSDGSLSDRYMCDFAERPRGRDAVVVACYHRDGDRVSVLVREGLRPAMRFGRPGRASPFFCEVVAGILEEGDEASEDGIRRRAAAEVAEEAGYAVTPDEVVLLGHTFPSPGSMPERFWLAVVEIRDPAAQRPLPGDGSPMEEDARTRWLDLDQAIASCVRGEIEDMKTELVLCRLRDRIRSAASP